MQNVFERATRQATANPNELWEKTALEQWEMGDGVVSISFRMLVGKREGESRKFVEKKMEYLFSAYDKLYKVAEELEKSLSLEVTVTTHFGIPVLNWDSKTGKNVIIAVSQENGLFIVKFGARINGGVYNLNVNTDGKVVSVVDYLRGRKTLH